MSHKIAIIKYRKLEFGDFDADTHYTNLVEHLTDFTFVSDYDFDLLDKELRERNYYGDKQIAIIEMFPSEKDQKEFIAKTVSEYLSRIKKEVRKNKKEQSEREEKARVAKEKKAKKRFKNLEKEYQEMLKKQTQNQ